MRHAASARSERSRCLPHAPLSESSDYVSIIWSGFRFLPWLGGVLWCCVVATLGVGGR